MPFSYLQYYTMTIQINHYLHIICARNFLFLITLHFKNFMVPDTLLRQIHLSDKLFTHTPKFSHLAQLYFQVSNCAYHSHLQFSLVNTFFFILSNIIAYFLILTIFLKTPYYIYTPQPPKTDAIRQNKTENFHLLPYLLSHYSFFSLVPHRISNLF